MELSFSTNAEVFESPPTTVVLKQSMSLCAIVAVVWARNGILGSCALAVELAQHSIGWESPIMHWRMTTVKPEFAKTKSNISSRPTMILCLEKKFISLMKYNNRAREKIPDFRVNLPYFLPTLRNFLRAFGKASLNTRRL